ncbi:neural cell adhesion molecule 1-like isoform X2 [Corticium candelabrum]|nr:neural cell adhesion molecule 1-like isoform X2 [Corticium candelabrum]
MAVFSNGKAVNNGVVMVMEGSMVTIICSVAYSSKKASYLFNIFHYHKGHNNKVELFDMSTNSSGVSYTISSITMDQFGTYVCHVFALDNQLHQVYQVGYESQYVMVLAVPTLIAYNTTAIEGDRAVLHCSGRKFDSIVWKSSKRDVYNDSLIRFHGEKTTKMVIKRTSRDYTGIYECRAVTKGIETNIVAHVVLVVFYPPSILEHPSNQTVAVGESVQFGCVVNGHPTPLITWKRNGILLDVIMRQSQLDKYYTYQSEVGSVFVLKVKTVEREEENDYYTCKVENDYGSLESKKAYLSMADDTVNAIQGKTSSFASQSPAVSSVAASEKNTSSSTDGFGSGSAVNLALGDEDFSVIQTNLHLKSSEAPTKSSIAESRKPYDQLSNVTREKLHRLRGQQIS